MTLAGGTSLGPYEILSAIGAGGMGEVYRARDTRLKRDVAIKILPESFAADPDRLARFQREAEVLASLNHPNIAHIHGLEESGSVHALVMELIEGEDLSQRIARGPIPIDEALPIAKQVAEALEAAHEQGIVHRDLKPANIKVGEDGTVKVLDFGLAKLTESPAAAATGPSPLSMSPTITSPALMTGAGVLLGTAAYMSPEQAKGRAADKRSDIWAFGCVLYEMLTGKRAFDGEDVSETLAAVLRADPDWDLAPRPCRNLLKHCLEKDPKRRLRDLGDTWRLLEEPEEFRSKRPHRRNWLLWVAMGGVAIIVAGGSGLYFRQPPRATTVLRATILPPDQTTFNSDGNDSGPAAISPDGTRIVFSAQSADGRNQLWVRALDALAARPLTGTEGATYPFWSPDGRRVGFFADSKLKRVDLSGGLPFTVCDLPAAQLGTARGGTWSADGIIVFSGGATPLFRVSAAGGAPSPVTSLDPSNGITTHRWPWFLPDGRHFLYLAGSTQSLALPGTSIRIGSIDSQEKSRVVSEAGSNEDVLSQAVYAPGYLLFSRQNTLMAQPFNVERLTTTADPMSVADQVSAVTVIGHSNFSVSDNGMLVYQSGAAAAGLSLTWLDRKGARLSTLGDPGNLGSIKLSPDEKTVAVSVATAASRSDIWLYDVARQRRTRFTFDPADDRDPVWSPDGQTIVFSSNRKGHFDLYRRAANLTGEDELLYADGLDKRPTAWSKDGKYLLYMANDPKTRNDVWVLPLMGERKPFLPFAQTPFDESYGQFSPDSRWITYMSAESQGNQIYVVPFAGANGVQGGKRQVSTASGRFPRWRSDGKEIFFFTQDRRLMAAEVTAGDGTIQVGAVSELFGGLTYAGTIEYDASLDGGRFIVLTAPEQKTPSALTLVQNWTADLGR